VLIRSPLRHGDGLPRWLLSVRAHLWIAAVDVVLGANHPHTVRAHLASLWTESATLPAPPCSRCSGIGSSKSMLGTLLLKTGIGGGGTEIEGIAEEFSAREPFLGAGGGAAAMAGLARRRTSLSHAWWRLKRDFFETRLKRDGYAAMHSFKNQTSFVVWLKKLKSKSSSVF
jgi:hypothetical protein